MLSKLKGLLTSSGTKLILAAILLASVVVSLGNRTTNKPNVMTDATVMITNMEGNSGGTGVVVSANDNESEVLTNSHVCGLLKTGGKVITTYGESHVAKYYKQDTDHDLCLVVIASKLRTVAKIATESPALLSPATISGHPNLLPNILTKGHFAGNKVIQVFTGVDKCTDEQAADGRTGFVCFFFGGIPVIRSYETMVVSATIMPGSSGSAVYNDKQEVSGLAFAGSGDIGYAYIVPYEYVTSFLSKNLGGKQRETFKLPDYKVNVLKALGIDGSKKRKILNKCLSIDEQNQTIQDLCKVITDSAKWGM